MMQVDLYGFQLIGDLPPSEGTGELIWLYVKFLIISTSPKNLCWVGRLKEKHNNNMIHPADLL